MAHLDKIASSSVDVAINFNFKTAACCVAWQPGSVSADRTEQIRLDFIFILAGYWLVWEAIYCEEFYQFSGWLK